MSSKFSLQDACLRGKHGNSFSKNSLLFDAVNAEPYCTSQFFALRCGSHGFATRRLRLHLKVKLDQSHALTLLSCVIAECCISVTARSQHPDIW